jgi:hypothetical protein
MKNYVGRKIRGFKFEDGTDGVDWMESKKKHIGREGLIISSLNGFANVEFDYETWLYPLSLIEPHLIEEETPEIIDLSNVDGVEMMVSDDYEYWVKAKVIAKLVDAYIDNHANVWYYAEPIPQIPKYTHAELVEKLGHDFEIIK